MKRTDRTNSFRLLWEAIKSSRRSMWSSLQVLIALTVVLATIFFIAEYKEHGEDYNFGNSLVWAFTRYIEDPGEFSTITPSTLTGRWMATLIGIVGILIFAVPAGLIGGAFTAAIEDDQRKAHLRNVGERLEKAFRRKQEPKTMYKCVPRYISLGTLQALKNMTQNDVIDAVDYNRTFRVRNLATAETDDSHPLDQLVVEMFPLNTGYGCCIDRGSDVTIACPTAFSEAAIGNFAYYLALIGGFNFISKEVESNVDDPTSFYIISDENKNPNLAAYIRDLRALSTGKNHWTIFVISSENKKDADLHFVTHANSKTERKSTIVDTASFDRLYPAVSRSIDEKFGIKSDLNDLRPAGPKNAAILLGGGIDTNAFTIRIFSEFVVWDGRYMAVADALARDIASTLCQSGTNKMASPTLLKEAGFGYQP